MCDCYAKVDEQLKPYNTQIARHFVIDENRIGMPFAIETRQVDKGRGQPKARALFASFCPFCGDNLRKKKAGG